jgi:hypothetical protein
MRPFFYFLPLLLLGFSFCTSDQASAPIPACEADLVLAVSGQQPSACGIASGGFAVGVTSGGATDQAVEFSINGGEFQAAADFNELAAGTYTIMARRGSCTGEVQADVVNSEGLNVSLAVENARCGSSNGSIEVTPSEASGEVNYSIDGGAAQTSAIFSGLAAGTYMVTATDDIGCVVSQEVLITTDVDFETARSIIVTTCAIPSCHGGSVSPNFTMDANIVSRAGRIKARTQAGTMPPASSSQSLSQAQIDMIACWVDDGAPM